MEINWEKYRVPYKESTLQVREQLEYLFSTADPNEEVVHTNSMLYAGLLPLNFKPEDLLEVYDIFDCYNKKDHRNKR
jgi:hypothetical protein